MIVEAIINLLVLLVLGVVSLFPTIPKLSLDFLNGPIRMLSLIDLFVSLRVVVSCLVFVLILQNLSVIWGVIMWVVRKLPGVE